MSGLLPRDQETSFRHDKIKLVNQKLRKWCQSGKVRNVHYLKPDKDWTEPDGQLVERYYFSDFLHLVEEGYEKFAKSIYEAIIKVSQGNVVTTVLPKPKPTVTLPPPTAIAPKLKTPPTVTSTLIPTIPPTTTSPLIMTTQPTATLPLTPTIPPTATLKLIPTIPLTATLLHIQTTTLTLPPRALTTTLPPTTTIPPSLRPTTILTPKHLPKCNRPINTPMRPTTVSPKPNPPARTPPTTTIPPIRTPNSTLPTDNITHNNLTTQTDPTIVEKSTEKTTFETGRSMHIKLFTNLLSLSILLLLPFTLLCLTNKVAFNVEFRDCKQSFLCDKRNLYITNIFHHMHLKFKVFNNNVSNIIHSLPISGIAYKLDGDFPSKNFTHKIHHKSGNEAHTIKLVFLPLLFLFMVTISNWIRKETFSYYTNIKHKYLFLKSKRHFRKHGTLFVFQKILLFLLVVLTFDAKLPSRTQNDLNTAIVKDNELFTIQYITTADVIRSNHIKNQSSLYALTKLKFSKHHSYFKYLLILSSDINLHPGPVKYPCSVCAKPVRKRIMSCEKCGLWLHKKCDPTFKLENNSLSFCKPCQNKSNDNLDNVWVEFPFDDDFFGDKEIASFDEKIDDDVCKTDPVASWKAFNKLGLHLIHLNINSLLSKIDELREVARKTRATVIGITESKLDRSVLDGEINIDGYELVRSDRNRHGGGVACYIRSDISFSIRGDFSSEIENIFLDILLPKTKPILIGILYRPPDQSKFLDNLSTSISQTCSFNEQKVYILGDLNINLINSQKHTPNAIKQYKEFCSLHGIEQFLTLPTCITNNSSSLLDHILTNSADRISQFGIVNIGLSDHQLIYCTRKITRTRLNTHKYVKMRSLKYYSEDLYVKKLKEIDFPDYSNFKDINEAYSDFAGKVASVIDEIAPIKEVRVKSNSQDWFDAEINEEIERQDKLLAKFKKSRSHSDNENYKKSRNKVQRMIKDKKKNFVIGKLNDNIGKPKDNIGKPKELWKYLKSLGLPSKESSSATICLEKDGILLFDPKTNAEIFKDFYSNLANNLVKKLSTSPNKYGKTAVNNYYKKLNLRGKNFSFAPVAPATILKLLKQLNPAKSAGIDNLTGKFLKEGAPVLASPITDLVNLSISLSLFPDG